MENDTPPPPPPPSPPEPPPVPVNPPEPPPVPTAAQSYAPPPSPGPGGGSTMGDEKNMAMFCHLSALAGGLVGALTGIPLPFGNVVGPLIIWLMKKDTMPMVNEHGKEVLNFQITVSIAVTACLITFFLILPIFLAIVIAIAALVLTIIGTIKASNGELYRYPFTWRVIK
jgi:uncharacterized Tic20 family protein